MSVAIKFIELEVNIVKYFETVQRTRQMVKMAKRC
jgi:hypothetical protein